MRIILAQELTSIGAAENPISLLYFLSLSHWNASQYEEGFHAWLIGVVAAGCFQQTELSLLCENYNHI